MIPAMPHGILALSDLVGGRKNKLFSNITTTTIHFFLSLVRHPCILLHTYDGESPRIDCSTIFISPLDS
jgi:hypothetical protein